MIRSFIRTFFPNPLDWMVKRCAKRGGKRILLGWNRGLGDLALGLYAIIQRIREIIPDAEITFLIRENLQEGFTLLEGVRTLIAPGWTRGEPNSVQGTLKQLQIDPRLFDLIIERPSPTDWVSWQRGKVIPRLKRRCIHDDLWKRFDLPDGFTYIGVQPVAETKYGLWRNWPVGHWEELFQRLELFGNFRILLFGFGDEPRFANPNVIDLRGRTSLFEFLSIVKNRCSRVIFPDSGLLSMVYYLDENFPLQVLSLWADPYHGILKQAVRSPNAQLVHHPLIGHGRDLSTVSVNDVMNKIVPVKPLYNCVSFDSAVPSSLDKVGCILLAGGHGSRLGYGRPKGTFSILGKSLFQWICEKAPEKDFPIAVMTAPSNSEETIAFFSQHGNFGREIHFFQQDVLPFLDEKKEALQIPGAPNGNGGVYQAFARSPLKELFFQKGIEWVTLLPVDNALAEPADARMIGHGRTTGSDVVVKCVKRENPEESMGAIVERGGRVEIVEYIDLDQTVFYPYSYVGMMAMAFRFFLKMGDMDLPLHWVKKKPPGMEQYAWKREKFLFDVLPFAPRVSALSYPRFQCYAPLKASDSIASVERLLKNSKHFEVARKGP